MKQILCFGDSNTYGLIPAAGGRYGWEVRWTGLLGRRLEAHDIRIVEEGLCGRTTVFDDALREGRRGSELLPVLLESHNPVDAVILMLGTNDCKTVYKASAEVIGRGIARLLDQIKERAPQSRVLLISPIALGEKVWQTEYDPEFSTASVAVSKELGAVYERIAKERGIAFLKAADYAASSDADQEHLDEEGHRALADAVYEKLASEGWFL